MAEVVAISLEVDGGNSYKQIKKLEQGISDLIDETNELNETNLQFKKELQELTNTYNELPKSQLAARSQVKKQMEELKFAIKDNNIALQEFRIKKAQKQKMISDLKGVQKQAKKTAQELGDIAEGVGQGYKAFLGVTTALGGSNDKLIEAYVKLEAVTKGLEGFEKLRKMGLKDSAFLTSLLSVKTKVLTGVQKAYTLAVGVGSKAMKTFRLALISTGIGALVVLLGTIIAKWDDWKDSILKIIRVAFYPFIKVLEFLGVIESDLEKERRINSENQVNRLQKESDKLDDITAKENKRLSNEIEVAKARGENTRQLELNLLKAERQGAFERLRIAQALYASKLKLDKDLNDEEKQKIKDKIKEEQKAFDDITQRLKVFKAQEFKIESDSQKAKSAQAKANREKRKQENEKAEKEAAEKAEKEAEKEKRLAAEKAAELKELKQEFTDLQNQQIEDENQRAITQLETEQKRELDALIKKYGENTELEKQLKINQKAEMDALKEEQRLADEQKLKENQAIINEILKQFDLDAIEDTFEKARKELEIQRKADEEKLILAKATQDEIDKINKVYSDKAKKISEEETEFKKKLKKEEVNQALEETANVLGSIVSLVGEGSKVGKAAAIAQATISTYLAAQKAYTSVVETPIVGPVLAPIAAGVAIANGIKSIRKIVSTKIPGGGMSGGTGITPPTFSTPTTTTTGTAPTGNNNNGRTNIPTTKVVLVESELQAMQTRRTQVDTIATI